MELGIVQQLHHLCGGVLGQLNLAAIYINGGDAAGLQHLAGIADGSLLPGGIGARFQSGGEISAVQSDGGGDFCKDRNPADILLFNKISMVYGILYAAVVATIAKLANYREVFSSKNDVTLGGYIRC